VPCLQVETSEQYFYATRGGDVPRYPFEPARMKPETKRICCRVSADLLSPNRARSENRRKRRGGRDMTRSNGQTVSIDKYRYRVTRNSICPRSTIKLPRRCVFPTVCERKSGIALGNGTKILFHEETFRRDVSDRRVENPARNEFAKILSGERRAARTSLRREVFDTGDTLKTCRDCLRAAGHALSPVPG